MLKLTNAGQSSTFLLFHHFVNYRRKNSFNPSGFVKTIFCSAAILFCSGDFSIFCQKVKICKKYQHFMPTYSICRRRLVAPQNRKSNIAFHGHAHLFGYHRKSARIFCVFHCYHVFTSLYIPALAETPPVLQVRQKAAQ